MPAQDRHGGKQMMPKDLRSRSANLQDPLEWIEHLQDVTESSVLPAYEKAAIKSALDAAAATS
jgi:hypothetical protein